MDEGAPRLSTMDDYATWRRRVASAESEAKFLLAVTSGGEYDVWEPRFSFETPSKTYEQLIKTLKMQRKSMNISR